MLLLSGPMIAEDLPPEMLALSLEIDRPFFWGVVRDSGGEPIVGAKIELSSDWNLQRKGEKSRGLALVSDGAGRFSELSPAAPDHAFRLKVTAPGYVAHSSEAVQIDNQFREIVLETAVRVKGRVVDREGRPIAGARWFLEVDLGKVMGALGGGRLDQGSTEADGTFHAEGAPGGKGQIKVYARDGWRGTSEHFALALDEVRVGDVRLDREPEEPSKGPAPPTETIQVQGRVVDSDGLPLPGASVQLLGGQARPRQTTDEQGRWSIEAPGAGKYYLVVKAEDRIRVQRELDIESETAELVTRLDRGGTVWGEIHGLELRHFSRFEVRAVTPGRIVGNADEVDRGPPATYRITGIPLEQARLKAKVHNQAPNRDFGELVFQRHGDVIRRDLVFEPGTDLTVRLSLDGTVMTDFTWTAECPERGRTGGLVHPIESTFVIYDVDPGRCVLRLQGPGSGEIRPGEPADVVGHQQELWTVDHGGEVEIALRSAMLSGTLTDEKGAPIAGAQLTLGSADQAGKKLDWTTTDDRGRFDFRRVVEGRWLLRAAEPEGDALGEWPVDVEGRAEVELAL